MTVADNVAGKPAKMALAGMTLEELTCAAESVGLPRRAGGQIARRLYVNRTADIDGMTELPLKGREALKERYTPGLHGPKARAESADGTVKYLFEGCGGCDIESVYIPDGERATLCVSSQAGCRMNCRFCATGHRGFHGNLTAGDIVNQILSIPESGKLTNIVFMGMGEPLDNLDAVLKAIEVITAKWGLGWSPKRVTVSTVGKLDGLKRLLEETRVHVALSVHSPVSGQRAELMPVERRWQVADVMAELKRHDFAHQRRLSLEYIMFEGVNDDLRHAELLARLCRGADCRVNLIRFHPFGGFEGRPSAGPVMERFRDRLNSLGITATIRASRGEDIDAACGMLSGRYNKDNNNQLTHN